MAMLFVLCNLSIPGNRMGLPEDLDMLPQSKDPTEAPCTDMKGHQTRVSQSGSCDNVGNISYIANLECAQKTKNHDPTALKNEPQIKVDMHLHQSPPTQACLQSAKQKSQQRIPPRRSKVSRWLMFGVWDTLCNTARIPILNEDCVAERAHTLLKTDDEQVYGGGRRLTADRRSSTLRDVNHAPQDLPPSTHKVGSESASSVPNKTKLLQATSNGTTALSHQSTRHSSSQEEKRGGCLPWFGRK